MRVFVYLSPWLYLFCVFVWWSVFWFDNKSEWMNALSTVFIGLPIRRLCTFLIFWLIAIVEFDTPHCGFSFFFITFFMYLINFSDSEWVNAVFIESRPIVFDGFSVYIDSNLCAYTWFFIDSDCKFRYCVLVSFFLSFFLSHFFM